MTRKEVIDILTIFNAWRRGDDESISHPHPKIIGKAIDFAIDDLITLHNVENKVDTTQEESYADYVWVNLPSYERFKQYLYNRLNDFERGGEHSVSTDTIRMLFENYEYTL